MKKILFIKTSPTNGTDKGSISCAMLHEFKKNYILSHPNDEVLTLDLNIETTSENSLSSKNLSTFFSNGISDKYINELKSIDKVVIGAPMINFTYPAVLKNYLDRILVANKTFSYKYNKNGESIGLMKHLKVQLLTTQGAEFGWYPWGNHTENLKGIWEFMGANVVSPITIFGTKTPEKINLSIQETLLPVIDNIKSTANNF